MGWVGLKEGYFRHFLKILLRFNRKIDGWDQCCIIRSVPAGTDGKSRTGMLTGTSHPYVPPRPKSRPVPARSARSGLFRPVSAGKLVSAGILFGLWFFFFFSAVLLLSSFFFFFFFFLLLSSFFFPPSSLSNSLRLPLHLLLLLLLLLLLFCFFRRSSPSLSL
jgi:hypothetical protein